MISGHVHEKNGRLYMVLNLKNEKGESKRKWITTGLTVRGNKTEAEKMLRETIHKYEEEQRMAQIRSTDDPLFTDYMQAWLKSRKRSVQATTYMSYHRIINSGIIPYFENTGIRLSTITPDIISAFYDYLMEEKGNNANTVKHYHANIRKALNTAFIRDIIPGNPADKVELPKDEERFSGSFYDADEIGDLFAAVEGHKLECLILVAAYYGLRRSEVLGLKWDAIDFKKKCITISHVVAEISNEEGRFLLCREKTKNISSLRTLPLMPEVETALILYKERQRANRKVFGNTYSKEYLDYIFLDEMGSLIKPNYVSQTFTKLLKQNHLRPIRFHDLRHSCASLLMAKGIDIKRIQEWLGHASIETTSKFYGHLKFESKIETADAISSSLKS